MKKIFLALVITLAAVSAAAADTVYLRGGTTLRGTLLGFINGRFAFQLNQNASLPVRSTDNRNQPTLSQSTRIVNAGEVIFLRPRDIERIEIDGRSLDEARYQTRTVDVALGANWVDSGVDVRRGERIRIDATGTIYAGRTRITPAGLSTTDPGAPLPRAAEGQLIAVIGNHPDAPITEIGAGREFTADRDGRLYLTVNRGTYTDARGAFNVRVRKEIDLTAMSGTARDDRVDDNDPFGLPGETSTGPAPTRTRRRGDFPTGDRRSGRSIERTITVSANESRGVDTGVEVRAGDQITINATGSITAGQRVGVVSADGARAGASSILGVSRRPVPTAGVGALIGYITQGAATTQPFLVGSQLIFTAQTDGRLYLLVNDDNYNDNSGSFAVRIVYQDYR